MGLKPRALSRAAVFVTAVLAITALRAGTLSDLSVFIIFYIFLARRIVLTLPSSHALE
jgi:hypothetical protein